jgi:hypothetical protein
LAATTAASEASRHAKAPSTSAKARNREIRSEATAAPLQSPRVSTSSTAAEGSADASARITTATAHGPGREAGQTGHPWRTAIGSAAQTTPAAGVTRQTRRAIATHAAATAFIPHATAVTADGDVVDESHGIQDDAGLIGHEDRPPKARSTAAPGSSVTTLRHAMLNREPGNRHIHRHEGRRSCRPGPDEETAKMTTAIQGAAIALDDDIFLHRRQIAGECNVTPESNRIAILRRKDRRPQLGIIRDHHPTRHGNHPPEHRQHQKGGSEEKGRQTTGSRHREKVQIGLRAVNTAPDIPLHRRPRYIASDSSGSFFALSLFPWSRFFAHPTCLSVRGSVRFAPIPAFLGVPVYSAFTPLTASYNLRLISCQSSAAGTIYQIKAKKKGAANGSLF